MENWFTVLDENLAEGSDSLYISLRLKNTLLSMCDSWLQHHRMFSCNAVSALGRPNFELKKLKSSSTRPEMTIFSYF